MGAHVALLRGVNVGGNNRAPAAELKAMAADLGFGRARTLLASGNLVFDGGDADGAALEARLEAAVRGRLGIEVDVLVRTGGELAAIIDGNPFPEAAEDDPSHLVVMFLKAAPDAGTAKALEAAPGAGPEQVRVRGREIYVVYPEGIGTSKLVLKARGTARNWNTVTKLLAMTAH